ncbi:hypothetical protein DESC_740128 [Desulfosarcina cetonica]|nr:hypothetical protein DESC_740128 [Desulfosarcina cetonica]
MPDRFRRRHPPDHRRHLPPPPGVPPGHPGGTAVFTDSLKWLFELIDQAGLARRCGASARLFRLPTRTGLHHLPHHQMVEGPDQVEVDRTGPVAVAHGGEHGKLIAPVSQRMCHDAEIGAQMVVRRGLGDPKTIFFGPMDDEKRGLFTGCERDPVRRQRLQVLGLFMAHQPQTDHQELSDAVEHGDPPRLKAKHAGDEVPQGYIGRDMFQIPVIGIREIVLEHGMIGKGRHVTLPIRTGCGNRPGRPAFQTTATSRSGSDPEK